MTVYAGEFSDRYERQSRILSAELLRKHPVTVIGIGAIGRQVALQLAVIGVSPLVLIDDGTVKPVHLGAQGFREADVGKPKVEATADMIAQLNSKLKVVTRFRRFHRSNDAAPVVFCGVDSAECRNHIFRAICEKVRFFLDARTNGESVRVLTVHDHRSALYYPQTLFRAGDGPQKPAELQATYYAASAAAAIMVAHYARWLRGLKPHMDVEMNLLADELVVHAPFHRPRITPKRLIHGREPVGQTA